MNSNIPPVARRPTPLVDPFADLTITGNPTATTNNADDKTNIAIMGRPMAPPSIASMPTTGTGITKQASQPVNPFANFQPKVTSLFHIKLTNKTLTN